MFRVFVFFLVVLPAQVSYAGSDAVSRDPNFLDKGTFGRFKVSLNKRPYGYEVIPDPTGTAPTRFVEKFEVRPGDCANETRWSDCANDRERAELSHKDNDLIGKTYWYGWSLYIPDDFQSIWPVKVALGQWHQRQSHPVWMIQHQQFGLYLDDHVQGRSQKYYPLVDFYTQARGRWTQFEFQIKWSKSNDGYIRVWVNGEQIQNFVGRTSAQYDQYFKYGLYRSFLSRYQKDGPVPAQTVYYANVRRADTRAGLAVPASLKKQ